MKQVVYDLSLLDISFLVTYALDAGPTPRVSNHESRYASGSNRCDLKHLPHRVIFLGVVCELSEPKTRAKHAPPPVFALATLIVDFMGVVRGIAS